MTRAPLMTRTVPTTPGPPEGFASAGLGSQPGPGTGGAVPEDRLSGPASALEESMVAALNAEVLARGDATGLVDAAYTLMPSPMGELVVVVTDGRATHGPDALARSRTAAAGLASLGVASVVVDCETGRFRMGLAADLAHRMGAEHIALEQVAASGLVEIVTDRTASRRSAA